MADLTKLFQTADWKQEKHVPVIEAPDKAKKGEIIPFEIGRAEFAAHGESVDGADTSTVYAHHKATLSFKTDKPGTIHASSLCNIHGLWMSAKELEVE